MHNEELYWIDTHCHIGDEKFQDERKEIIERAENEGVKSIVAVGDTIKTSRQTITLTDKYDTVFASVGIHPHHAKEWSDEIDRAVCALLMEHSYPVRGQVIALGEIGLDYYYDFAPRDAQREMFLRQVSIAREFELPVILHCREAWDEMLDFIEEHDVGQNGGILHCFAGTVEEGKRAIESGLYLGVGGIITFKKSDEMREVITELGPEHLVIETDAPYLAPVPRRGKRNEPSYLPHTARRLAEMFSMSVEELKTVLLNNSRAALRCQDI